MIKPLLFSNRDAWLAGLELDFIKLVGAAIIARGVAHIALSGGSTPKPFYAALAKAKLPWDRIDWWLGDERWVPVTDAQSNERMIREVMGVQPKFDGHFHSWHLAQDPAGAASLYEKKLSDKLGKPAAFDLILLGLGSDGHTASLFPGSAALEEKTALAVKNDVDNPKSTRLTFTFPLLDQAREVWFLVEGKEKEGRIDQLMKRDTSIPSARVNAPSQKLYWNK